MKTKIKNWLVAMLACIAIMPIVACDDKKKNEPEIPEPETEEPEKGDPAYDVINEPKLELDMRAVDMGLSVRWGALNVGAEDPTDFGDLFAWGETKSKNYYARENSRFFDIPNSTLLEEGVIDESGNLTAKYDAAAVKWGGKWRMPTSEEVQELMDKCTWTWTEWNDVPGYDVTGPNGMSIFLPVAGIGRGDLDVDEYRILLDRGWYYTATVFSSDYNPEGSGRSGYFYLREDDFYNSYASRYHGLSVRPVIENIEVGEPRPSNSIIGTWLLKGIDYMDYFQLDSKGNWKRCWSEGGYIGSEGGTYIYKNKKLTIITTWGTTGFEGVEEYTFDSCEVLYGCKLKLIEDEGTSDQEILIYERIE